MKTIFYLVRHGKTLFNNLGRFQGRCDSELLPEGIEMARRLHDGLKDVDFALAATSTSERAVDTLKGILQEREIPTIYCKGLKEMAFGRLEGALIQLSDYRQSVITSGRLNKFFWRKHLVLAVADFV